MFKGKQAPLPVQPVQQMHAPLAAPQWPTQMSTAQKNCFATTG